MEPSPHAVPSLSSQPQQLLHASPSASLLSTASSPASASRHVEGSPSQHAVSSLTAGTLPPMGSMAYHDSTLSRATSLTSLRRESVNTGSPAGSPAQSPSPQLRPSATQQILQQQLHASPQGSRATSGGALPPPIPSHSPVRTILPSITSSASAPTLSLASSTSSPVSSPSHNSMMRTLSAGVSPSIVPLDADSMELEPSSVNGSTSGNSSSGGGYEPPPPGPAALREYTPSDLARMTPEQVLSELRDVNRRAHQFKRAHDSLKHHLGATLQPHRVTALSNRITELEHHLRSVLGENRTLSKEVRRLDSAHVSNNKHNPQMQAEKDLTEAITRQAEQVAYLKEQLRSLRAQEHEKDRALRRAQLVTQSLEASNALLKARLEDEYNKQDALERWARAKAEGLLDQAAIRAAEAGAIVVRGGVAGESSDTGSSSADDGAATAATAAVAAAEVEAEEAANMQRVSISTTSPIERSQRHQHHPHPHPHPHASNGSSSRGRDLSPLGGGVRGPRGRIVGAPSSRDSSPANVHTHAKVNGSDSGSAALVSTPGMTRDTLLSLRSLGADLSLKEKENARLRSKLSKIHAEEQVRRAELEVTKRMLNKARQHEREWEREKERERAATAAVAVGATSPQQQATASRTSSSPMRQRSATTVDTEGVDGVNINNNHNTNSKRRSGRSKSKLRSSLPTGAADEADSLAMAEGATATTAASSSDSPPTISSSSPSSPPPPPLTSHDAPSVSEKKLLLLQHQQQLASEEQQELARIQKSKQQLALDRALVKSQAAEEALKRAGQEKRLAAERAQLERENQRLQNLLDSSGAQAIQLENKKLQAELASRERDWARLQAAREQEVARMQSTVDKLRGEVEQARTEVEALKREGGAANKNKKAADKHAPPVHSSHAKTPADTAEAAESHTVAVSSSSSSSSSASPPAADSSVSSSSFAAAAHVVELQRVEKLQFQTAALRTLESEVASKDRELLRMQQTVEKLTEQSRADRLALDKLTKDAPALSFAQAQMEKKMQQDLAAKEREITKLHAQLEAAHTRAGTDRSEASVLAKDAASLRTQLDRLQRAQSDEAAKRLLLDKKVTLERSVLEREVERLRAEGEKMQEREQERSKGLLELAAKEREILRLQALIQRGHLGSRAGEPETDGSRAHNSRRSTTKSPVASSASRAALILPEPTATRRRSGGTASGAAPAPADLTHQPQTAADRSKARRITEQKDAAVATTAAAVANTSAATTVAAAAPLPSPSPAPATEPREEKQNETPTLTIEHPPIELATPTPVTTKPDPPADTADTTEATAASATAESAPSLSTDADVSLVPLIPAV